MIQKSEDGLYDISMYSSTQLTGETLPTYYREFQISNHTSFPICILEPNGSKYIIDPLPQGYCSNQVLFEMRTGRGEPRVIKGNHPATMETMQFAISEDSIYACPFYFKYGNLLVAHAGCSKTLAFPGMYHDYHQIANEIASKYYLEGVQMRLVANDPTGTIDRVYVCIGGDPIAVPVTNIKSKRAAVELILHGARCNTPGVRFSIKELITKDDPDIVEPIELSGGFIAFVALSKEALQKVKHNYHWVPIEESPLEWKMRCVNAEAAMEAAKAACEATIAELKEDHARELKADTIKLENTTQQFSTKIVDLESKIAKQASENEALQRDLAYWKDLTDKLRATEAIQREREENHQKILQSQAQTERLNIANDTAGYKYDEAKLKYTETLLKIGGTLLTLVVGVVFGKIGGWLWDKLMNNAIVRGFSWLLSV